MDCICNTALGLKTQRHFNLTLDKFGPGQLKFYGQILHRLENRKRGKEGLFMISKADHKRCCSKLSNRTIKSGVLTV